MSDKVLKSPQIRFAGYTDNWEQREFKELVNRISKSNKENGLPRVEYEDVASGQGFLDKDIFTKESNKKGIEIKEGDTLFGKLRPYLQNWLLVDFRGVAVGDWWVLRPKQMDNRYLYFLIQSRRYQTVANLSAGTKMPRADWNIVSKTEFIVPNNKNEQSKIGSLFRYIDNLITLQQRKLELLKETKRSLLQKMFPREGANVPEIRFAGFTDVWEQIKMKDCFTERSERSAEGELISVTINSGVVKTSDLDRKDNSSLDKSKYKVVKVGDIAYNSMRMWQGASGFSPYDGILSPAYTVITPKENNNQKFFAHNFKRHEMIWIFQINSQGLTSDTWNLKFPALSSIKIAVPSYEEQTKIALFFERVDYQLALHQRELNALKNLKKSLLHQMFV